MSDKEQRIKERRTTEAIQKNFMGHTGKLSCIAHFLGSKIISEDAGFYSSTLMEDVWEIKNDEYDPTIIHDAGEDSWSREIGYVFDGMSRGIHLEIRHMIDDKILSVYYKGFPVYKELSGDLDCYAPDPVWEEMIEKLFKVAKQMVDSRRKEQKKEDKITIERNKNHFLDLLRSKWGVK